MTTKILLADDSVTIQKVVELTFSEQDYEVIAVGNGNDAIQKARETEPDIALLDVIMPGRDGYEVCAILKQDPQLQHIPVLLLTGTFDVFDTEKSKQVGANGYIIKPFESQELISRVRRLVGREGDEPSTEEDDDLLLPELEFEEDSELIDFSNGMQSSTLFDFSQDEVPDEAFSLRTSLEEEEVLEEDIFAFRKNKGASAESAPAENDEEPTFDFSPSTKSTAATEDVDFEPTFEFAPAGSSPQAEEAAEPSFEIGSSGTPAEEEEDEISFNLLTESPAPKQEAAPSAGVSSKSAMQQELIDFDGPAVPTVQSPEPAVQPEAVTVQKVVDSEELEALKSRLAAMEQKLEQVGAAAAPAVPEATSERAFSDADIEALLPPLVEKLTEKLLPGLLEELKNSLSLKLTGNGKPESNELLQAIAWQVVPDVAEMMVRKELERLQRAHS